MIIFSNSKLRIFTTILCVFLTNLTFGQEEEEEIKEGVEKPHEVAFVFGFSHIPAAFEEGEPEKEIYLPTIGFDYYYKLNEKWKLAFVLDFELAKYQVNFDGEEIKREGAIVTGLGIGYEVLPRWTIGFGPGLEFERNKNIIVFRFNTDYAFEIGNDFALAPYFNYDFKQEYDTFSIGIGLHKSF